MSVPEIIPDHSLDLTTCKQKKCKNKKKMVLRVIEIPYWRENKIE